MMTFKHPFVYALACLLLVVGCNNSSLPLTSPSVGSDVPGTSTPPEEPAAPIPTPEPDIDSPTLPDPDTSPPSDPAPTPPSTTTPPTTTTPPPTTTAPPPTKTPTSPPTPTATLPTPTSTSCPTGVAGSIYFVSLSGNDNNCGSRSLPWRDMNLAVSRLKPGHTLVLLSGTYRYKLTIRVSGTSSAPITIRADVAQKTIIDGGLIASEVILNYGNYINIVGFDVRNGKRNGIADFGAFGRIEGNSVHDIAALCDSSGGSGIVLARTTGGNKTVIGNTVYRIAAERCVAPKMNTVHGIYIANRDNIIQNNIVHNVGACGIHTWHAASRGVISNNLTFNNGRCGIIVGSGDNREGTIAERFIVSNNIVVNNWDLGIYESGEVGRNQYLNNLSWGNRRANWMLKNGNVSTNGLSADPQFVNYIAEGTGDYRLKTTSPALRKGNSLGLPTIDILGVSRVGKPIDLGPYQISQ